MNLRLSLLVGIIAFFIANLAYCQFDYDFFWSDRELHDGAINQNLVIDVQVGDVVPLYLYWSTNGPADSDISVGCAVDVSTSQSGIIQFDSAESYEFEILVGTTSLGNRWTGFDGIGGYYGPADVQPDFINAIWAFTVTGNGLLESNNGNGVLTDAGYDVGADAFSFGQMTFTAVGPGTVQLITATDETQCVNGGSIIDVAHSVVTVNVGQEFLLGDVNMDGTVNLLDVPAFVQVLISMEYTPEADTNMDGILDLRDVDGFVELLAG